LILVLVMVAGTACQGDEEESPTPAVTAMPTRTPTPVGDAAQDGESSDEISFITIATDAPSRFKEFEDINPFGDVIGFDPDVMAYISGEAGIDYEFVVTSFDGLLVSVSDDEFDAAMSALIIPEQPEEGLNYTDPYLEIGQVLVVRANETVLLSHNDIEAGIPIGAQRFTSGEQIARGTIRLTEPDLQLYDSSAAALQALIDGFVEGVIIDNLDAVHFATTYPQQLKISGGSGQEAWINGKAYGIAVSEGNEPLLELLNEIIARAHSEGVIDQLTDTWLVSGEDIVAGESLVGTPVEEIVLGVSGQLSNLDPAATPADFISWEVKSNIMAGLLMLDESSNVTPILATDLPQVSEDNLEYTLSLRPGLQFPSGNELTAEDVKFSVDRAARLGNYLVNSYLKDENDDSFADNDAVQVIDSHTVKFILNEPASYFPSVLATPPYFIVDSECYTTSQDPVNSCAGIGKYLVAEWEPGIQLRLEANPQWPGDTPNFGKIQVRFYEDPDRMRRSLENSAIDMAWTGLTQDALKDFNNRRGFEYWEGPPIFKSYLVFEHGTDPWDSARIREAIAMAVDRESLATEVFAGSRKPLYSPVPDGTPGHVASQPSRDLGQATFILSAAGYSPEDKLVIELWYEDGGRYSAIEGQYAEALKAQLEETGLIEVNISGAPYSVFRSQSATCNYPAYLLGWPSPGQPVSYVDAMSWIEYFITNTDSVCSNFESDQMQALYDSAIEENDPNARQDIYRQIQELWAQEYPTLDLTQEFHAAISLPTVTGVVIDAMGLLHFDKLEKIAG
jgi:peptide/nickel transport system substrate-binding protein